MASTNPGGFTANCPSCQRPLLIGSELSGQTVACPHCGGHLNLPPIARSVSAIPPPIAVEPGKSEARPKYPLKYVLTAAAAALVLILVGIGVGFALSRGGQQGGFLPAITQASQSSDFAVIADRFSRLSPRALPDVKRIDNVRYDVSKSNSLTAPLHALLQFDADVETHVWIPSSEQLVLPLMPVKARIRYVAEYALVDSSWQFSGTLSSEWQGATLVQDNGPNKNSPLARQTKQRVESWAKRELVGRTFQHDAAQITSASRDTYRAEANSFQPSSQGSLSPSTADNGQSYAELYDIVQFLEAVSSPDVESKTLPLYTPTLAERSKVAREGNHEERLAAAKDLGTLGKGAIPVLAELALAPDVQQGDFGSDDDRLRIAAVQSLAKIGPESIPTLVKVLDDKSSSVRNEAATALGSFGSKAAVAVPKLQEIARASSIVDRNEEVFRAIRQIDPKADVPPQPKLVFPETP